MQDTMSEQEAQDQIFKLVDDCLKDFQFELETRMKSLALGGGKPVMVDGRYGRVGTARIDLSKALAYAIAHTGAIASQGGIIPKEEDKGEKQK